MRKFILFLLVVIALSNIATAQQKVTVYCKMIISDLTTYTGKLKGQQVDIDYGTNAASPVFTDTAAIAKLAKIKTITNGIDAMNYMNTIGWELISIVCKYGVYTCFYKKELDK